MWNTIVHYVAEFGTAAIPVIATIMMGLISAVVYQLTGLLPGFLRGYADQLYRQKEAVFRDNIERALLNGLNAAVAKGYRDDDALKAAVNHAINTNPESFQHFARTSHMTPGTLKVMAEGIAERERVDVSQ